MIHWTATRKAELLRRIDSGEVTESATILAHASSHEELAGWRRNLARGGVDALRVRAIGANRRLGAKENGE